MPAKDNGLDLKGRFTRISALVVGSVLTLTTIATLGIVGWHDYQKALGADLERGELHARVLVDQATRAVETTSVVLTYLAGQLEVPAMQHDHARADLTLSQALVALPFVRGLSVIDAQGHVLASSTPTDVGLQLDMRQLGALPAAGRETLLGFVRGRSLAAVTQGLAPPANVNLGFIPLIHGMRPDSAKGLAIVALLNPDSFSNFQLLTLSGDKDAAYLLTYGGELLASSGAATLALGHSAASHAVFRQYLPGTEHASYVGAGVSGDKQVLAFRLSKTRPLVMVIEHPYADTLARWLAGIRWFAVASGFGVVFLGAMTLAVHRSIGSREVADAELGAARREVTRSERELRVLVRSVQELIFRTDGQGRLTYANDRWIAMRGQSVEHAINRSLADLVEPADRDAVAALFSTTSQAGVRAATAHMRSSDGVLHRFDFAVVPLRSTLEVSGFAGSAVDVTERFAAQQALQHQLTFVALLLEISPLPVATFDVSGRYVTVNRAWEDFVGLSREQVVGTCGSSFMSGANTAMHAERDAEVWRSGGTVRYEAKVRHRDGSRRDVVVTKVVVPGDGHDARLLITMMDVSEFREAERSTRLAKESAEESSRAKSEFIANISHELRTPLQTILGFSELGMARGRDQPKLHNMFTDIHAAGARMLALVNDLLDVSKIESSVGAITLERADLRELVHAVLRELSPLLAARHLQVNCDTGSRPLIAKVDPVRFQQVIRNVTANAIKFAPMGSTIAIDGYRTDDECICINVRDQGVGIPPGELEKIFDAFVQSSASKDGSGGTGLGLAICKKILDAHGGEITASNVIDGGAVFQIKVPARQHLDRETVY